MLLLYLCFHLKMKNQMIHPKIEIVRPAIRLGQNTRPKVTFFSIVNCVSLEDTIKSEDAEEWQLFGPKFVQLNRLSDGTVLQETISGISSFKCLLCVSFI